MNVNVEKIASKRGYVVCEKGTLYNPKGVEIGYKNEKYYYTKIRVKGKPIKLKIHRLQAYQKYGGVIYDKGIVVRHKDGDSSNNSWDNILIGTQSENMMDIPKQIRIKRAIKASSVLSKYNNEEVKKFHSLCNSYKETMLNFGISSKGTLHYILNN